MDNTTPPLNALKVFDAVVRFGSMSKAAIELGIAPSSVTQHIRNLEDYVGGDLFDRTANAIALNARGKAYSKSILTAFDSIHQATGAIFREISDAPLRISCVPTLAGPWLAEQLAVIKNEFPEQEIRCEFSPALADFASDEVDLAIRYGAGDYPGATTELIYTDVLAPVCAPETVAKLNGPDDLGECLRLDSVESAPSGLSIWRYWASLAGGDALEKRLEAKSPWILQSAAFSIEVLQSVPSVAILERAMVQPHLDRGLLVSPFDMWVSAPYGYYIVTSNRRVLQPSAKRLKALLKRSIKDHCHLPE
ncbi:LysR substrate-binding domain-containing protein [Roseobacter weihaiensis]|uniref:LysR substrate-binding domain-containing protein n=1 Tax=Roseobacter weihaiensis TaxID=2763262 RepID=UPI001D0B8F7A|nr:LysR substrate-binding domain-containing protein [Roseobacter sp. H9]